MKYKMAANQALKRFSRQIIKEDAFYERYAIPADSFARMVAFAIQQPEDVDVNEILFRPTAQEL
jgi:NADP-dependent 3-hydroxy acid dehydrogenase YdfG